MNMPFFADTAMVEINGESSLRLIGADYQNAQYQVRGIQQLQVFLSDHRQEGVLAAHEWLTSHDFTRFTGRINTPAFVLITQPGETTLMIDLYDTQDISPLHTLALATDGRPLAIHNYAYYHYEPSGQDSHASICIYQNDPEPFLVFSRMPESVR